MNRLLAVLSLLMLPALGLEAQVRVHPFTEDELHRAFRFHHSEAEARHMARQALSEVDSPPVSVPSGGYSVVGVEFAEETLILLSLLSPEVNEKVERYRRRGNYEITLADQQRWRQHREELRKRIEGADPPN